MFVRFRRSRHRLVVSLIETRRVDGRIVSEHVAALGSAALPEPIGARERVRFWRGLKARFRDIAVPAGQPRLLRPPAQGAGFHPRAHPEADGGR
jgi:hypothetical protein